MISDTHTPYAYRSSSSSDISVGVVGVVVSSFRRLHGNSRCFSSYHRRSVSRNDDDDDARLLFAIKVVSIVAVVVVEFDDDDDDDDDDAKI